MGLAFLVIASLSCRGDSRRGDSQAGPSGESSTPISISSDSWTLPADRPMAVSRDSISEESLRGFVDGRSPIDLSGFIHASPIYSHEKENYSVTGGYKQSLPVHLVKPNEMLLFGLVDIPGTWNVLMYFDSVQSVVRGLVDFVSSSKLLGVSRTGLVGSPFLGSPVTVAEVAGSTSLGEGQAPIAATDEDVGGGAKRVLPSRHPGKDLIGEEPLRKPNRALPRWRLMIFPSLL
ncbi:uncharacterized protein G2W53_014240 [Senna tora]|uniref:Uncharacterized protein n=1 Tax=Senna tora TaxID=362788 RepID=A0A834WT49_9FABA|nr:uncharacterized protein G2W53_014240 [Senna tora]